MHGFLGSYYGISVRKVASYLTIVGFVGFALAETYFGSKVLLSVIDDKNIFYLIIFVSLVFVFGYISYGGQLSSIRTDQLQLIMSYVGIFGMILYFSYLIIVGKIIATGFLSLSFVILIVYIPLILFNRKFQFIKVSESDMFGNNIINSLLNTIISILLVLIFAVSIYNFFNSGISFRLSNFFSIEGFGIPGLISLAILPLCWQFVDLTNWQRLLSVKQDSSNTLDSVHKNIKKGLLVYAFESPFTWIIFLFFGLLTINALPQFTFQDLLVDIPKRLISSNDLFHNFCGYSFIVSILAIMLSTIDSFIVGIIFTFVYDTNSKTQSLIDSKENNVLKQNYKKITNSGKLFGFIIILLGMILFIVFDKNVSNGGELFINLLLAFYSAQLSFFPLVFGILFLKKHPSPFWTILSMLIGSLSGISLGIYAVIWNYSLIWYPIIVCFALSTTIYFIGYIKKREHYET